MEGQNLTAGPELKKREAFYQSFHPGRIMAMKMYSHSRFCVFMLMEEALSCAGIPGFEMLCKQPPYKTVQNQSSVVPFVFIIQ